MKSSTDHIEAAPMITVSSAPRRPRFSEASVHGLRSHGVGALALLAALFVALPGCDDTAATGKTHDADVEADGASICPATGRLITPEACDGIDNDCDGFVDEGFDLQSDPDHCGACQAGCDFGNALAVCRDGVCGFGGCPPGTADRDGDPSNGCEAECDESTSPEVCDGRDNDCDGRIDEDFDFRNSTAHCGGCDIECTYPNADALCDEGICRLARCQPGWGDSDRDPSNGCEAVCEPARPGAEVCDDEDNDCDGLVDEGFDVQADGENCGACGVRCAYANAAGVCDEGECRLSRCEPGFSNADGDESNGCETRCEISNGGVEVCDESDNDCNGIIDDGIDKERDVENCGGCGVLDERFICRLPNAVPRCDAGECVIDRCEPGFANADGETANGCEQPCLVTNDGEEICDGVDNDCDGVVDEGYDLQNSLEHCGACDAPCEAGNAVPVCDSGRCRIDTCPEGFVDLDQDRGNGCEYACAPAEDGVEICDGVDNDCDGRVDEGFDLFNDLAHCGGCNALCDPPNALAICNNGLCDIGGCDEGWFDSDGDIESGCDIECTPTDLGIEICDGVDNDCDGNVDEDYDLQTDPLNCGECDLACGVPNALIECEAGECVFQGCRPGWVDANNDLADGCEYVCVPTVDPAEICDGLDNDCDGLVDEGFDLAVDLNNCGICGRACAGANAVMACQGGACGIAECAPGFVDINRDVTDGCEAACVPSPDGVETCNQLDDDCDGRVDEDFNLAIDVENCGECGRGCDVPSGQPFCNGGVCAVLRCEPGFVDLDADPENGCECQITNGGVEICDGIDNDCNGVIDDAERMVPPVDFQCLTLGVCAGTRPTCAAAQWTCPYPATYEENETRCDTLDNDCDSVRDDPYPDLGRGCAAGQGICRGEGTIVCDGLNATHCSAAARPELATAEICNDLDDDCDGMIDEDAQALVRVAAGGGVPAFDIFAYEASRTDANAQESGRSFARACSKTGAMPWVTVDYATAGAACASAGMRLCSAAEWTRACAGGSNQTYPYGNDYQPQTCNGTDFDADAVAPGNQDEAIPTGSLAQCRRVWNNVGLHDQSGNVWEWTTHDVSGDGSARGLRGGSFGNVSGGLTCQFVLASPIATARDNVGFRCCRGL